MIQVDRRRITEPEIFKSDKFENMRKEIQLFYQSDPRVLEQTPIDSISKYKEFRKNIYGNNEIKEALIEVFYNKCAYCESQMPYRLFKEISLFRPRTGVANEEKYNHLYYGWLSFEWENLYLSCVECNRGKSNLFPVNGDRAVYLSSLDQIRKIENYLLVDPCFDNPQEHITFDGARAVALSDRGTETIKVLELNRPELVARRFETIKMFKSHIEKLVFMIQLFQAQEDKRILSDIDSVFNSILETLSSPYTEHKGCLLAFARSELFENKLILDFTSQHKLFWDSLFSTSIKGKKKTTVKHKNKYRTISKIIVKNLKDIKDFEIELNENEQNNWLMILGENATGKSTLLKLIAMNLAGKKRRNNKYFLTPDSLVADGKTSGSIRLVFTGHPLYERELIFNKDNSWSGTADKPFEMMLLGYGPVRLSSNKKDRRIERVRNLFDHFSTLININEWLIQCYHEDKELFDGAARCIRSMIPLENQKDNDFLLVPVDNQLVFRNFHRMNDKIPLASLSSGYRNIFTLVIDIFYKMGQPDSNLVRGIVLLDEIDVHLHPRWKMSVVSQLKELFKNVQFITTSHDPLCLSGLKKGEIMVLERREDGVHVHSDELPTPEGLRTDQLLTSEFFGLHSTIDIDTEELFIEYYALLAKREPSDLENKRIKEIQKKLKKLNYMGTDRREQLMYKAIDEYLANSQHLSVFELKDKAIKHNALNKISAIWKNANLGDSDD
ncbi:AAA family ATPase [Bacillus thuringiensis]|uniref:AAA family ATPase n=1 Tax=Bacillus thuringiensis TaxID=1428 RepID=UPI0036705788